MQSIRTGTAAILALGLLAGSMAGVVAEDQVPPPPNESHPGVPSPDVHELEWAPLRLDAETFPPGTRLTSVAASDSMVVIGGSVGRDAAIWTSVDGIDWTRVPHDEEVFGGEGGEVVNGIVPWRGGFVAAGEVDPGGDFHPLRVAVVWVSEDGQTWTRVPHDEEVFGGEGRQEMFDIAATDDRLVIVGFDEEGPCCTKDKLDHDIAVWTSSDAVDWEKQTFGGGWIPAVAANADRFVAGGSPAWSSVDGTSWQPRPLSGWEPAIYGVTSFPGGFVAVGSLANEQSAWVSDDGADWALAVIDDSVRLDDDAALWDVASSASGLAAVAGQGWHLTDSAILVSPDGETWVEADAPPAIAGAGLRKIAAAGSHFVALGEVWTDGGSVPTIWTTLAPGTMPASDVSKAAPVADNTTTPDLLPGVHLVTEEVEPGVYRVLNDGVRDVSVLPAENPRYLGGVMDTNIAAGPDGSVWLFGLDGFFRLGEEARHGWHQDFRRHVSLGQADFEVGPDGVIWLHHFLGGRKADNGNIWSFDGEAWSTRRKGAKNEWLFGVEVQDDGTVWTAWHTDPPTGKNKRKPRATAARLGASGWEELPGVVRSADWWGDLVVADGGGDELRLMTDRSGRLRRHDGNGWVVEQTPEAGGEMRAAVGADGTLWVRLHPTCGHGTAGDLPDSQCWGPSDILASFDGEAWEVFGPDDGIPMMGDHYMGFEGFFEVAPDRSVWFNPIGDYEADGSECDGIASFDGQVLRRYLRDHCITAMDVAPDGTVWLRAFESDLNAPREGSSQGFKWIPTALVHTYAITPEAVAAAE